MNRIEKSLEKDLRLCLIEPEGNLDIVFSSSNGSSYNSINIPVNKSYLIHDIAIKYYVNIRDSVYDNENFIEYHLDYLQDFINKNIKIRDMFFENNYDVKQRSNILYYYLNQLNYVVIVCGDIKNILLFTPIDGITNMQNITLQSIKELFNKKNDWSLIDDLNFKYVNGNWHSSLINPKKNKFDEIMKEIKYKDLKYGYRTRKK